MHAARAELRSIPATTQKLVRVEYKGLVFDEPLRFDLLVDGCLLVELKAVEILHPSSKAQLLSYMKLLDIPIGLLINFHEPLLKKGISRMILPGANQKKLKSKISRFRFWTQSDSRRQAFVLFVSFCEKPKDQTLRSAFPFTTCCTSAGFSPFLHSFARCRTR